MSEQITQIILQIAPSVITILTMIGMIIKMVGQIKALKAQVVDMKPVEEIREQLSVVIQENQRLQRRLDETMTKIDHIKRG